MKIVKAILICLLANISHAQELSHTELKAEIIRISAIQNPGTQRAQIESLVEIITKEEFSENENKGAWSVKIDISPIDDSKTVVMTLMAQSPIRAWIDEVSTPALILRLREGQLESFFSLGVTPNVESGDTRSLTLRFDSSPAKVYEGSLSTNNKAVFLRNTRELIREISSSKTLTLRFTPFNSNPVTTTFNLAGFDGSATELLTASGLDLDDKSLLFEDEYRNSLGKLSSSARYEIGLNKNIVTIKVQGGRWKPYARDSAAVDLISKALDVFKDVSTRLDFKLIINLSGSVLTTPRHRDEGLPFSAEELQELFDKAIDKSEFDQSLISRISSSNVQPTYYGKDDPAILVGVLQDTNESITITVEF